jgi:uncharacterized protein (TIGR02147 family)
MIDELPKINVEEYDDYRILLNDLFLREKKINPHFSYEYCAKRIGGTKSYLKLIFQKKNHTSISKLPKISKLFKLNAEELEYLLFLYLKNSSSEEELNKYFDKILQDIRSRLEHSRSSAP